jgi:hypothetical protein
LFFQLVAIFKCYVFFHLLYSVNCFDRYTYRSTQSEVKSVIFQSFTNLCHCYLTISFAKILFFHRCLSFHFLVLIKTHRTTRFVVINTHPQHPSN